MKIEIYSFPSIKWRIYLLKMELANGAFSFTYLWANRPVDCFATKAILDFSNRSFVPANVRFDYTLHRAR